MADIKEVQAFFVLGRMDLSTLQAYNKKVSLQRNVLGV